MPLESARPIPPPAEAPDPRRVLVIDDEPGIRSLVRRALNAVGHLVDEAPGGCAGIDAVIDRAPDVVLLDLQLPDLPGEEVLRVIRATRPQVPVIMWTAGEDAYAERHCRSLGAGTFLRKPVPVDVLVSSVDSTGRG